MKFVFCFAVALTLHCCIIFGVDAEARISADDRSIDVGKRSGKITFLNFLLFHILFLISYVMLIKINIKFMHFFTPAPIVHFISENVVRFPRGSSTLVPRYTSRRPWILPP